MSSLTHASEKHPVVSSELDAIKASKWIFHTTVFSEQKTGKKWMIWALPILMGADHTFLIRKSDNAIRYCNKKHISDKLSYHLKIGFDQKNMSGAILNSVFFTDLFIMFGQF